MKHSFIGLSLILGVAAAQPGVHQYLDNKVRVYFAEEVNTEGIIQSATQTGMPEIDEILEPYGSFLISQWLPQATEKDRVDDILLSRFYDIKFRNKSIDLATLRTKLAAQPSVKIAEYVPRYRFDYKPNDPLLMSQWYLRKINAEQAWQLWDTAAGEVPGDSSIVVSIVDSGCQWDHPDLVDNLWNNLKEDADGDGHTIELIDGKWQLDPGDLNDVDDDENGYVDDLIGWDVAGTTSGNDPDNDPMAPSDPGSTGGNVHGTHVAGIVAASTDNEIGIASIGFSVSHMAVKIQYDENPSDSTFDGGGSKGVLYSAKAGARVINLSWGHGGRSVSEEALYNNVKNNYGVIVVAAAGNENSDEVHYPSGYSSVVAVAASNSNDKKSGFSNYGTWVDIIAPGSGILSTVYDGDYQSWSGTSMASPLVAGAIGLLWSYYPRESDDRILEMLLKGTDNIDDNNSTYAGKLGSGRLNMYRAIASGTLPQLRVASYSVQAVDDDDGVLNPGETGLLRVVLENDDGWADASSVTAELSTDHWAVTLIDSEAVFPNIPSGNSGVNVTDRFKFRIDPAVTPEDVPFTMVIRAKGAGTALYYDKIDFSVKVSLDQAGFPFPADNVIRTSPTIIDIDGDGELEVIAGSDDHKLYVLDPDGEIKWTFEAERNIRSAPAVGDVDGDGSIELVFGSMDNFLYILSHDGTLKTAYQADGMIVSSPALADLDHDGDLEIIFPVFEEKLYVIHHDGTDFSPFPLPLEGSVFSGVAIGDVDADGELDIVVGTWDNKLYLLMRDGTIPSGFPFTTGDRISTDPALADLNGDGTLEIFIGTDDKKLHVIDWQGQQLAAYSAGGRIQSSPIVDDLDSDGITEIIFGGGDGKLYSVQYNSGQLTDLEGWPVKLGSTPVKSSPVAFDLDNDGIAEAIASSTRGDLFAVRIDGTIAPNFPVPLAGATETSFTASDLDGDGDSEIAAAASTKLTIIDVKTRAGMGKHWRMYRGGPHRIGVIYEPALYVQEDLTALPEEFSVSDNYPNPFNPITSVRISLPMKVFISAEVYDLTGKLVKPLVAKELSAGIHFLTWDGSNEDGIHASTGIYFLSVRAGDRRYIQKMTLLK
ncbi:MAG: S8 family serine peptidase [Candidatus Neomarinimicrobiota bacterium]|nr:S8 family serine peptidase [Candidatus Neomarinimicrobiota bacterium]